MASSVVFVHSTAQPQVALNALDNLLSVMDFLGDAVDRLQRLLSRMPSIPVTQVATLSKNTTP